MIKNSNRSSGFATKISYNSCYYPDKLYKYLLFYCLQESHDHSFREKTSMLQKFLLPEFKISVQNRGQHFDAKTLNKVTDDLFHFHKFYTERKAI